MGLLLSVLVQCIGVIEVIACYEHFRYSIQERRTEELLQIKHNLQREFEVIDEHNHDECSTCEEELLEQLRQTYEEKIFANETKSTKSISADSSILETIDEIVDKEITDDQSAVNAETLNKIIVSSLQIQQGIIIGNNFLEGGEHIPNGKVQSDGSATEEEYVPIVEGESLLPPDTSTTTVDEDTVENTKDQISSSVWTNDESVSEIQSTVLDKATLSLLNNEIESSENITSTELEDQSLFTSKEEDIQSESLVVNFNSSKDTESEIDTTWLDEDRSNLNDTESSFWSENTGNVDQDEQQSFWEHENADTPDYTSDVRPAFLTEQAEAKNLSQEDQNIEAEEQIESIWEDKDDAVEYNSEAQPTGDKTQETVNKSEINVENKTEIESFWEEERDEIDNKPEVESFWEEEKDEIDNKPETASFWEEEKDEIDNKPEIESFWEEEKDEIDNKPEVESFWEEEKDENDFKPEKNEEPEIEFSKQIESSKTSDENETGDKEDLDNLQTKLEEEDNSNNIQESLWPEEQEEDNFVVNVIEAEIGLPLADDKTRDLEKSEEDAKRNHLEVNVAEEELSNATDLTDLSDESEAELQFENKDSDPEVLAPNDIGGIAMEMEKTLKEDEIESSENSEEIKKNENVVTDIKSMSDQPLAKENFSLINASIKDESLKIMEHEEKAGQPKPIDIVQTNATEGIERTISSEIPEIAPAIASEILNISEEFLKEEEGTEVLSPEDSPRVGEEISEEVQAVLREFEHVPYEPPEIIELIRTPEPPIPADVQFSDEIIEEVERADSPDVLEIPEISEELPYVVNFVLNPTAGEEMQADVVQNDVGNVSNDFSSVHYNIIPQVRGAPNEILEENVNTITDELSELSMFTETDLPEGFEHADGAFYLIDDGVTKTHVYIDRKTNSVVELIPDIQHDQLTIQDYHEGIDRPASPYPPDEVVASNKNRLHIPDSVIEGESSCDEDKNTEEEKDETKDIVEPLPEKSDVIKEDRPKLGDKTMSLGESSDDIVLFEASARGKLTKRVSFAEEEETVIPSPPSEEELFEEDDDNVFLKPDQNSLDIKWDNSSSDEIELPKPENETGPSPKIPSLDIRTESLESEYDNQNLPPAKQRENLPAFWNRTITSQNASLEQTSSIEFPGSQNTSIDQNTSLDLPLSSQVNIQESGSTLKKQITLATDLRNRFAKMDSSISVGSDNQSFEEGSSEGFIPQSTISIQQKQLLRNDSADTKPLHTVQEIESSENQSKIFVKNYDGDIQCFIDENGVQGRRKSDTICIKEPDGTLKCFETVDPENVPEDVDLEYKKPQHVKCIVINDIPVCEIIRNNNDEPVDEETIRNQRVLEIDIPVIDPEDVPAPNVSEEMLNSLDGIRPSSSLTRDRRRKFRNHSSSPNSSRSSSRSSRSSRDEELRMFTSLEEQEQGISQSKLDELLKHSTENLNENSEGISSASVLSSPRLKRKPNSYRKTRSSENLSVDHKRGLRHSPSKQRHQTVDLISDHDVIHEDVKLENQLLKHASDITTTNNELNKISDDGTVQNTEENTNSSTGQPFWSD
ncbi:uncharacterized protein LOC123305298 [Chrysoperla carnea]|uniref:uncharacterized protein LOC123305298 n=1 Tax=Chrysoperla carnea TaxID=189513 RepID=UPI001D06F201|nr:uncharacterized protein LOC123305298 [Chrysoperla carnea]